MYEEVEFEVELEVVFDGDDDDDDDDDNEESSKNPLRSCSILPLCPALWLTTTPSGQTRSKILSKWIHKLSVCSSIPSLVALGDVEEVGEPGAKG